MVTVRLEERDEGGAIMEVLIGELEDGHRKVLQSFISHLERMKTSALVRRGIPRIKAMRLENAEMRIEASDYTDAELHELLHVLRPLILHNESASFGAIRAVLGRIFKSKRFSAHLKGLQHMFDHGDLATFMQITIGEQPLFDDSLVRTWLNGTQYHTEEAKAEAWKSLQASITEGNARAVVINQLSDKVNALLLLGDIVMEVIRDEGNHLGSNLEPSK